MRQRRGQLRAVVFDLDGTLVHTMPLILDTYVNTIRSRGGPNVTIDDVLAKFHLGPTPVVLEHFLGRPISSEDMDCYHAMYNEAITGLEPFPGVVDMLGTLHQMGYRRGLFTSATRRAVSLVLPRISLDRYFEAIIAGDEITHPKPAPDGLDLICWRLGVNTKETAYVGDAEVDLACARSAKVLGIQVTWGSDSAIFAGNHLVASRPDEVITVIENSIAKVYKCA